ncbi:MAG: VanZ family protein [Pseudomonadota bacterium]
MRKLPVLACKFLFRMSPVAAIAIAVAIAILSLLPQEDVPGTGLDDQVNHFIAYGALSFTTALALEKARWWKLGALLIGYGVALEVLQAVMPFDRYASAADGLANAFGVLFGLLAQRAFLWGSRRLFEV